MRRVRWRLGSGWRRAGLAFGLLTREVVPGLLVAAAAGDRDAMDRSVDLTAAAAIQAMAMGSPGADGIGATPAARACLASLAWRSAPAISHDELGRGQRSDPRARPAVVAQRRRRALRSRPRASGAARRGRSGRASSAAGGPGFRPIRVLHFVENSAEPGSTSSGQRSFRCRRRSLLPAVRARTRRSRWSTSSRISSSGPANDAVILKERQLAARSGPSPRRQTSPTPKSKQQASKQAG
jgi:hypothetical protein